MPVCTSRVIWNCTPPAVAVMNPFSSKPCVAPMSLMVMPAALSACCIAGSAAGLAACSPVSSMRASCPRTFTPCTVVDDAPTGSASSPKRASAIDVIESIVTRPPSSFTPSSRDSTWVTGVAPSNEFDVVDCIEPEPNSPVSTGAPGVWPGSVRSWGRGRPVGPPAGSGAIRSCPICASVDDVPSSSLITAWAPPPSPYSAPPGSPNRN
jgi:hypothetical protein